MIIKKINRNAIRRNNSIIGIDFEWTKNYRIKNGNKPFCYSVVEFSNDYYLKDIENELKFNLNVVYVENEDETPKMISMFSLWFKEYEKKYSSSTIVGHQLSSDIGVINNYSQNNTNGKYDFYSLKDRWSNREKLFDTRYDLNSLLKIKSRRLVDICRAFKLDVTQPELSKSMTRMQNEYYVSGENEIMEKLMVLNIRHSLSSAMLYFIFKKGRGPIKIINVNRIIYNNLKHYIPYVSSMQFSNLL